MRTQRNRGEFYQNFCLRLLETRNCAGWMHFEIQRRLRRHGGFEQKGLVSVEYTPYADYLNLAKELHTNLYPLASYYDAGADPRPSANACAGRNPQPDTRDSG